MDAKTRRQFLELLQAERRAGYAEGYAAAKREGILGDEIEANAKPASSDEAPDIFSIVQGPGQGHSQVTRGVTMNLIEQYLAANPKCDLGNLALIREIKATTGVQLSETTVARAMLALAERGVVHRVPGTKAWRYVPRPHLVKG